MSVLESIMPFIVKKTNPLKKVDIQQNPLCHAMNMSICLLITIAFENFSSNVIPGN